LLRLSLSTPRGVHVIEDAAEKLRWRGGLPGASIYDQAAQLLRVLQASGAEAMDLLPFAFSSSWYVNARASSRAMQRWLFVEGPRSKWSDLLTTLSFSMSLDDWETAPKEKVAEAIAALAVGEEGATLVAITKVLALLRPQLVPLMDDAAIWFALGTIEEPQTADAPKADATQVIPMMDWFAESVLANEKALTKLAAEHSGAVLDAPQVLDRLLWMESWGNRLRKPAPTTPGAHQE